MSVRELHSEIEIDAPASRVWAALTETAAYPEWNPFIRRLDGDLRAGCKLEVRIEPPGARGMTFRPTVLAAETGRGAALARPFPRPRAVRRQYSFELAELPGCRTRLVQRKRFQRRVVGPFGRSLDRTAAGFAAMNEALRDRVEASVPAVRTGSGGRAGWCGELVAALVVALGLARCTTERLACPFTFTKLTE